MGPENISEAQKVHAWLPLCYSKSCPGSCPAWAQVPAASAWGYLNLCKIRCDSCLRDLEVDPFCALCCGNLIQCFKDDLSTIQ